jgi:protein-tyrosine phosphatase
MYIISRIKTKLANIRYRAEAAAVGTSRLLAPLARVTAPQPANAAPRRRLIAVGCKGNICRSPYAHVRLEQLIREKRIDTVDVTSFGLETTPGLPADGSARRVAGNRGVELANHLTSRLDLDIARKADLILVMEPHHLASLYKMVPEARGKSLLLGLLTVDKGWNAVIEDPFGREDERFGRCFDQIDLGLKALVERL